MQTIVRDGVKLAYTEVGRGGPPLLCVHGFGGSSAHFAAQLERFGPERRVVAIDRRGHGASDVTEGPYDIPSIAEEVIWSALELGLRRPVLVVHSMGAIGLEVARQAPDLLSGLVVLDAPAFPPPEVREAFQGLAQALSTPAWKETIDAMCDQLIFLPTDDRARRERLHAGLVGTPQHVLASTWQRFLEYDPVPAGQSLRVPLLFVASAMPVNEQQLRATSPHVWFGRTVGAGHFAQLEVPDQVNGMIARFLEVAVGA